MNVNECLKLSCPELHRSNVRLEKGRWGSNLRHHPGPLESAHGRARVSGGRAVLDIRGRGAVAVVFSVDQRLLISTLAILHCKSLLKTVYKQRDACAQLRTCARHSCDSLPRTPLLCELKLQGPRCGGGYHAAFCRFPSPPLGSLGSLKSTPW